MAASQSWAIVGSSRGIGQEFVKQLLARGDKVIATVRHASLEQALSLHEHDNHYSVIQCDMLSESSIDAFVKHLQQQLVIALHPGEVKTDMANIDLGGEVAGQMTPAQSVEACIPVIESKNINDSGTFWTWENKSYPW